VKNLLPAFALALQFKASKWQGQALKCQGQGLTSLESHTEAGRAGGSLGRGQWVSSPPTRRSGERCKLPQWGELKLKWTAP